MVGKLITTLFLAVILSACSDRLVIDEIVTDDPDDLRAFVRQCNQRIGTWHSLEGDRPWTCRCYKVLEET